MTLEEKPIGRICPQCGRVLKESYVGCPHCGKDLTGKEKPKGRMWAIIGIVCGAVAFLIFGIPLGIAAIICGSVAVSREDNYGYLGIALGIIAGILAFYTLMILF
ncbi:MAG: hypothetical protein PVF96_04700 [Candidatus Bathyarchaeota archaeon]|jgi:hypothetical protein